MFKKNLLIFACFLLAFIVWAFPYIDELRDQGLTADLAYDYFFGGPDHPFDPKDAVPQLDYSKNSSWASLPSILDEADLIPAGEEGAEHGLDGAAAVQGGAEEGGRGGGGGEDRRGVEVGRQRRGRRAGHHGAAPPRRPRDG